MSPETQRARTIPDRDPRGREAGCQRCGVLTPIAQLDNQGACPDCAREHWEGLTAAERTAWCKTTKMHYPYEDRGPMTREQLERMRGLLESHPFRFAKTMPRNLHWYTLRYEWSDVGDAIFNEVVRAIREHGYTEWFGTFPWRMLDVNGFKYWTYYSSYVEEVIVLNRKPLAGPETLDEAAQ